MSNAQNSRVRAIGGVVATAAIPAVIFGSLASPAVAAPQPVRDVLQPKMATPSMVKAAEARIGAQLVAAHVPTSVVPLAKKSDTVTVKSGDTLSHISARTGVSVSALKKANGLRSDTIFPNQVLRLSAGTVVKSTPTSNAGSTSTQATKYTVVNGDTLGAIANKLGISLSVAREAAGNPSGDLIHIGQTLRISGGNNAQASKPSAGSSKTTSSKSAAGYTVRAGDTASGIALRHNMSVSSFLALNNLSATTIIRPGQVLKVSGSSANPQSGSKAPATSSKAPAARQGSYTVVQGDTLIGIANKTNTPVTTLLRLNGNLSYTSTLSLGQRIKTSGTAGSSTSNNTANNSSVKPTTSKPLVGDTFLGRKYSSGTVNSANANKQALLAAKQPSRAQMQALVAQTARQMGVSPSLALAHAFQESSFDMTSVSPANAVGVMQVIPSAGDWAERLVGRQLNLLDPKDNVTAGIAIIRHHQNNSPSKEIGIASYYQGATGVKKFGMYPDTKRYVANIMALQNRF